MIDIHYMSDAFVNLKIKLNINNLLEIKVNINNLLDIKLNKQGFIRFKIES